MSRVFANRIGTVMAAEAVADNVHVIEIRRQPANRTVTIVAVVAARNMVLTLACGGNSVVTRSARAQNLCVINHHNRRKYIR